MMADVFVLFWLSCMPLVTGFKSGTFGSGERQQSVETHAMLSIHCSVTSNMLRGAYLVAQYLEL